MQQTKRTSNCNARETKKNEENFKHKRQVKAEVARNKKKKLRQKVFFF